MAVASAAASFGEDSDALDSHDRDTAACDTSALEDLLATKLAEYLDTSFPCRLREIPSSMKGQIYKGSASNLARGICVCICILSL